MIWLKRLFEKRILYDMIKHQSKIQLKPFNFGMKYLLNDKNLFNVKMVGLLEGTSLGDIIEVNIVSEMTFSNQKYIIGNKLSSEFNMTS